MNREELTKEQIDELVKQHGPKWCFRQGITNERTIGFTKPTLEKRRMERRMKNKNARKARKK